MGQDVSTCSAANYYDWELDAPEEEECLMPYHGPTRFEWARMDFGEPPMLSPYDGGRLRRTARYDEILETGPGNLVPPMFPRQPFSRGMPSLVQNQDFRIRTVYLRAPGRLHTDASGMLRSSHAALVPDVVFRQRHTQEPRSRLQSPAPAPQSSPHSTATRTSRRYPRSESAPPPPSHRSPSPPLSPKSSPRHQSRRSSHSGNPIVFRVDQHAPPLGAAQVRFHGEKGMQTENGGRCTGTVTNNEWKGLDKGLKIRMGGRE
ncbi:hypothetical protein CC86DRAFT_33416 [Ophiobolus disseminans]|uniref:Uncharacterized protein n=1 Tax=Ophiobolus disseminans TaxID=1469910 RepID=A0A6A6ZYN2_9PLEO|nr:hypothetical protein CC86DRAFT_33416 [Ophiobolus disseminans]